MSDIAIRIEGLGKKYRRGVEHYGSLIERLRRGHSGEEFWALKDVSFEVKQGEVLGIIGRNGAGKSTLLKILSRITRPTTGQAEISGRVGSLLEVGTGFHPELTGRENIYLNGAILGMKKAEIDRKFDEIVAFAEVEKFIDTPVKRYSSGMYVRLAFAVAAHLETEIMLVDEVLAVGDTAFQKKCLGKMGDVVKEGRTVLFVSHNMRSISNLTQHCIWIERGRIAAEGETSWVISEYLAHVSTSIPSEGWVDLSGMDRHPDLAHRKAQIDWVRILDTKGRQNGTFLEGEAITVELGVQVMERVRGLQFGCNVWTADGSVELFTVPSPEFVELVEPGHYAVKMYMNPNRLRRGDYTLSVKLFASGQRQDTIGPVTRLTIQPYLSSDDNPAYLHGWVAGHMRFDYEWGSIESKAAPRVGLSTS